jgi:hypothetical protein
MTRRHSLITILTIAITAICSSIVAAQGVKRVVIIKIDGLPAYYVDRFVKQRDLVTGRSVLPWIEEVFYKNGTRVPNFYTRGMSLSGPSWGQLDTGQRLQIKGNVEYDRYVLHAYDYLNFFPYYTQYGLTNAKADMPAAEVMDQLKIPLFCDAFDYKNRYTSQQLYQRGNNWEVLASGFVNLYPGNPGDFIDEWTLGLDFRRITINQAERDILGKLISQPDIDYFDYYDVSFDHVSHHNNDTASRLTGLKELDRLIGRMWTTIQASSRRDETALVLVSDHGFNSDEKTYSQGFSLVKMLASLAGGGHHIVTKRRLMLDYSLKGIYPLVPLIKTNSNDSYYLKGQSSDYPTALLDFDGNERSSIHLRNSDLNLMHILLQQIKHQKLSPEVKAAAIDAFFDMIDRYRHVWRANADEMTDEIGALSRWIESQQKLVAARPKKFTPDDVAKGIDKEARRTAALKDIAVKTVGEYRSYITTLGNLLNLTRENFDPRRLRIEDLIAPGSMGESNSVYHLQNYVVGLSRNGLVLNADKDLEISKSFTRVDYFELLRQQRVRNNVQDGISHRPIDFVAVRLDGRAAAVSMPEISLSEDPIWLYAGDEKQALILSRKDVDGMQSYRYLAIAGLKQNPDGGITFQPREMAADFPLRYYEDSELAVPAAERSMWFHEWHTEHEWFKAIHKTKYANALIGLNEQLDRHPLFDSDGIEVSKDESLIRRLRQRQRHVTEPDLLILANDHWNFDVRGFNPGGNHGSFLRVSTNSTFMIAGGERTGIPRGLMVAQPYDSLSFVPTLMRLMGKIDNENRPVGDLARRGFRRFPGRVIAEITGTTGPAASR